MFHFNWIGGNRSKMTCGFLSLYYKILVTFFPRAKSLFISFTDFPTLSSFYKPPTTIEPSWLFINFFSDPISNASIFNKLLQFTFINFSAQYKHTFNHKSFFCLRYSQLTRSNANNFNDNPDQIAETRDNVTTLKPIRD